MVIVKFQHCPEPTSIDKPAALDAFPSLCLISFTCHCLYCAFMCYTDIPRAFLMHLQRPSILTCSFIIQVMQCPFCIFKLPRNTYNNMPNKLTDQTSTCIQKTLKRHLSQKFAYFLNDKTSTSFLQHVSIACYAERCISYSKSVRLSVCPSVCPSVTRWH